LSIHHSLQRESKRNTEENSNEGLHEHPTAITTQNTNKLKSKKSLPLGSVASNNSSKHNSIMKQEKGKNSY